MDKKPVVKKLPKITNKEQLEQIFNDLYEQGFGYMSDYDAHNKKVQHIISHSNKLNIDYSEYDLKKLLGNESNYNKIDKITKKYFNKFKPDDKIKELFNNFYLKPDQIVNLPQYHNSNKKDIFNWIKFKKRWNIKGELSYDYYNFKVYNLDKNYIKINNAESESYSNTFYKFIRLYELLFGEKPNDVVNGAYGNWQDMGEIEIKIFQNGTMNIKGNIDKMKEYLHDQLNDKYCLIIYNKKRELRDKH